MQHQLPIFQKMEIKSRKEEKKTKRKREEQDLATGLDPSVVSASIKSKDNWDTITCLEVWSGFWWQTTPGGASSRLATPGLDWSSRAGCGALLSVCQ